MEQNQIIIILGKRGSGKSTLAKRLIDKISGRVLIYDTLNEYYQGVFINDFPTFFNYLECFETPMRFVSDNDNDFDRVCRVLYETQENIYLAVDETDNFCNAYNTPEYFKRLIRYGRHSNLGVIAIARRPASLSRDLTSQANKIISFKQFEPMDISYLKEFMPDVDVVLNLGEYEYLCYDTDTGKTSRNTVDFP